MEYELLILVSSSLTLILRTQFSTYDVNIEFSFNINIQRNVGIDNIILLYVFNCMRLLWSASLFF